MGPHFPFEGCNDLINKISTFGRENIINILILVRLGTVLYQKILVPIDGSGNSKRALLEAIKIAKMTSGFITLLHVQNNRSAMLQSPNPLNKNIAQNSLLVDGQRSVRAEGIHVESMLLEGNIIDTILRVAKEENFDLIVIGARGLSKLEEILMGSVSHGVVEKASCPVIVTK
jgi:nucleotide-binding universal stress UspA family protein